MSFRLWLFEADTTMPDTGVVQAVQLGTILDLGCTHLKQIALCTVNHRAPTHQALPAHPNGFHLGMVAKDRVINVVFLAASTIACLRAVTCSINRQVTSLSVGIEKHQCFGRQCCLKICRNR
jgi:hypothetical protein